MVSKDTWLVTYYLLSTICLDGEASIGCVQKALGILFHDNERYAWLTEG